MGLPHQVLEEVPEEEMAVFKKKLKMLENIKGRHTELITQYIPPGTDRSTVMNQLSEEVNQSGNIKSPSTRKNVQGALRKIIGFLKNINFKLPKNGMVVFAGNISENEGRSDIRLFTVTPVRPLKVKMYWCDSSFHLDHLKEMMAPNDFYAIMTIDKNESTIAQLVGKKYEILGHFTSMVPGKTRAGGQCLSPETQIILQNGEIKEIKDISEGEYIKSIDFRTGQTIDTKVLKKWKTKKQGLIIKTGSPQFTINCSKDHTIFVYENNKIVEKQAQELKQNDILLFSELIPTKPKTITLQNNNYNSFTINKNGQKMLLVERKKQNLYQKELAKLAHLTQTEISILELGKRNPRNNSKEVFKKQLIEKANSSAQTKLNKIYNYNILPTEILQIKEIKETEMVDLEVENKNFIANGIIVHNSSARFERLREEAMQDFFKKSAEKFNAYFEPYLARIKGVLIGGPGMTKNYFMEKKVIHHELEKKVIGIVDTAYTDEGGIRELVQKSQDLLKDSELVKERQILDKFLGEVARDGLATYGQIEVEKAIEEKRASTLIISEDIPWIVFRVYCEKCEKEEIEIVKEPETFEESKLRCKKCESKIETIEEISYLDYMIDKAKETGAQIKIISTETNEGKNFYEGFGGMAALLRYRI